MIPHCHRLSKDQVGRELPGQPTEPLALLRAVNPVQPYPLSQAVVQGRDRIAIAEIHNLAGEVGGEGLTCKQRKAKEQRQGSNRLGTAHGISGTARTAPILLRSGRKGDSGDGGIDEAGLITQESHTRRREALLTALFIRDNNRR